jgi:SAM-dependent methyltransferase
LDAGKKTNTMKKTNTTYNPPRSKDRIKTLNNMGSMFLGENHVLKAFLDHAERTKGYFADVGTAYGHASLLALQRGANVIAVDLEQRHLDVLKENCPPDLAPHLQTICGHYPNSVSLPKERLDGILLARLLLFLREDEIEIALQKAYQSLKAGGYIYIVSPSPLRKKWAPFLPLFNTQKEKGFLWPGHIENVWDLVPEEKRRLPNTIQLIDVESLKRGLERAGFTVSFCASFSQTLPSAEERYGLSCAIAYK